MPGTSIPLRRYSIGAVPRLVAPVAWVRFPVVAFLFACATPAAFECLARLGDRACTLGLVGHDACFTRRKSRVRLAQGVLVYFFFLVIFGVSVHGGDTQTKKNIRVRFWWKSEIKSRNGNKNSPSGIRTRVVWVKTTYPDQLD